MNNESESRLHSETVKGRNKPDEVAAALGILLCAGFSALVYFGLYKVLPQFAETFSSFDIELPMLTYAFVASITAFPVISALHLASALAAHPIASRTHIGRLVRKVIFANAILSFLVFILAFIAMYLPVMYNSTSV